MSIGPPFESIAEKRGMADGSIIVVGNYNADKTLAGLTTMYKVEGYNPEAGDWYWVEATPSGKVMRSGKVQPCIDCHRAQAGNDYIWTGKVVKGKYNKTVLRLGKDHWADFAPTGRSDPSSCPPPPGCSCSSKTVVNGGRKSESLTDRSTS